MLRYLIVLTTLYVCGSMGALKLECVSPKQVTGDSVVIKFCRSKPEEKATYYRARISTEIGNQRCSVSARAKFLSCEIRNLDQSKFYTISARACGSKNLCGSNIKVDFTTLQTIPPPKCLHYVQDKGDSVIVNFCGPKPKEDVNVYRAWVSDGTQEQECSISANAEIPSCKIENLAALTLHEITGQACVRTDDKESCSEEIKTRFSTLQTVAPLKFISTEQVKEDSVVVKFYISDHDEIVSYYTARIVGGTQGQSCLVTPNSMPLSCEIKNLEGSQFYEVEGKACNATLSQVLCSKEVNTNFNTLEKALKPTARTMKVDFAAVKPPPTMKPMASLNTSKETPSTSSGIRENPLKTVFLATVTVASLTIL